MTSIASLRTSRPSQTPSLPGAARLGCLNTRSIEHAEPHSSARSFGIEAPTESALEGTYGQRGQDDRNETCPPSFRAIPSRDREHTYTMPSEFAFSWCSTFLACSCSPVVHWTAVEECRWQWPQSRRECASFGSFLWGSPIFFKHFIPRPPHAPKCALPSTPSHAMIIACLTSSSAR